MQSSSAEWLALQQASELERPLAAVESCLAALGAALRESDAPRIEAEAAALHRALAVAVDRFGRAAHHGSVPGPLRQRLMTATAQVAAQREALARATASLDRAIDVLLPAPQPGIYAADGAATRISTSANLQG
jgi:hypothetical protein